MIERLTIHRESMLADLSINPKFREEILISHTNTHCSSEVQPRGCRIIAIVDIVAAYCEMHPRDTVLEKGVKLIIERLTLRQKSKLTDVGA